MNRLSAADAKSFLTASPNLTCDFGARGSRLAPARGLVLAEIGFWGEDGGLSWEEWSAGKQLQRRFSERLKRDQNGKRIEDRPAEQ